MAASLALVACASLYGGEEETPAPARSDDAASEDETPAAPVDAGGDVAVDEAVTDAGPCDAHAPFTSIAPIAEVNTPDNDDFAHLSTDEKTIYLGRGAAVAVYTRSAIGMPFTGGAGLDINAGNESRVRVTDDTLRTYFTAFLGGGTGANRVIRRSRSTTTDPFGSTIAYDFGADAGQSEGDVFVSPDEKRMYFVDNRDGPFVIYAATKNPAGLNYPDYAPVPLGTPDTKEDRNPVVTPDETVIYFSSNRTTPQKAIWVGYRAGGSDGGVAVTSQITELAAAGHASYPVYLSEDRCRLYFVSDREGGKGLFDIWLASRAP